MRKPMATTASVMKCLNLFEMFKSVFLIIFPLLTILLNKILKTKEYLDKWPVGIITPIHK